MVPAVVRPFRANVSLQIPPRALPWAGLGLGLWPADPSRLNQRFLSGTHRAQKPVDVTATGAYHAGAGSICPVKVEERGCGCVELSLPFVKIVVVTDEAVKRLASNDMLLWFR